jgi:hypothetical protein
MAEPRFSLSTADDVIAHIVCCREPQWDVAFCGEVNDVVALNATVVCTMCIEVAKGKRPGWDPFAHPPICPVDGDPCPDEYEIDLRILRAVTP